MLKLLEDRVDSPEPATLIEYVPDLLIVSPVNVATPATALTLVAPLAIAPGPLVLAVTVPV